MTLAMFVYKEEEIWLPAIVQRKTHSSSLRVTKHAHEKKGVNGNWVISSSMVFGSGLMAQKSQIILTGFQVIQ